MGRVRVGSLEIDSASRQVWVQGEPVALSKKEYALLREILIAGPNLHDQLNLRFGVWGTSRICSAFLKQLSFLN